MARSRARIGDDNNPLLKNKADSVIDGYEQVSKSTSQAVQETEAQQGVQFKAEIKSGKNSKSTSQPASQLAGQNSESVTLKKATYQIDAAMLDRLDQAHLRLQLELGKRNTPYKEVIVEEAIARILAELEKNPARVRKALVKRQDLR